MTQPEFMRHYSSLQNRPYLKLSLLFCRLSSLLSFAFPQVKRDMSGKTETADG